MGYTDFLLKAEDYIPSNLRKTEVFTQIAYLFDSLLSDTEPEFRNLYEIYKDIMYYNKNVLKLSYEVKMAKLRDLGFSYLIEIFSPTSEELSGLLTYFTLIRALKCRREGLELILNTFKVPYILTLWDETTPKGELFTGRLTLRTLGVDIAQIKELLRNYMAPLIEVVVAENVKEIEYQNTYFSHGILVVKAVGSFEIVGNV